jgi:exonuclease III
MLFGARVPRSRAPVRGAHAPCKHRRRASRATLVHVRVLGKARRSPVPLDQETKLEAGLERELALATGCDSVFGLSRNRPGYSGTATFFRTQLPAGSGDGAPGQAAAGGGAPAAAPPGEGAAAPACAVAWAAEDGFTGCWAPGRDGASAGPAGSAAAEGGWTDPSAAVPDAAVGPARPFPDWRAAGLSEWQLRRLDGEGRVVVTDHGAFVLVNCYGPFVGPRRRRKRMAYKLSFFAVRPRSSPAWGPVC